MTQNVGAFVPLQQRNAYPGSGCVSPMENPTVVQQVWPGSTYWQGPEVPPTIRTSWKQWPGSTPAHHRMRNGLSWQDWQRYISGYQGFKFPNPSFAGGYEGEKFYNPGEEGEYAGATMGHGYNEETIVTSKTVSVLHPKTRKSRRVTVTSVRPVMENVAEVDVGDGYVMLWDMRRARPYMTSAQACPPGYTLYKGRCFRNARVANPVMTARTLPTLAPAAGRAMRQANPRHPVYLNTYSLPWSYPWSYTHNPRTLQWGYTHPRWGYRTPWSGWGGYHPVSQGRAYYDDRVVCERVDDDDTCPVGTTVERDRDGNKMCCEPPQGNVWAGQQWPYYYWWCPGCTGYYPRKHHRRHRHHGARPGDRGPRGGGGRVGGGGRIMQSGGVRTGGGGGAVGGGGMIGQSGGVATNPGYEMEREENPCNACNVRVPTGPVDMRGNPTYAEKVEETLQGLLENRGGGGHGGGRPVARPQAPVARPARRVQPWEIQGPCPPGEVQMGGECVAP